MRKTLFDIAHISAISLAFLILISGAPSVNAGITTAGVLQVGTAVNVACWIPQQSWSPPDFATSIGFFVTTRNPAVAINGWLVSISGFPVVWSARVGINSFDGGGMGANVAFGQWILVTMTVWLLGTTLWCPNQLNIQCWWNNGPAGGEVLDAGAWGWGYPKQLVLTPTQYNHLFNMTNTDSANSLTIVNLGFLPTMSVYDDLTTIVFPPPYYNVTILPLQSWLINITTTGPFYGGHIYFRYNVTFSGIAGGGGALQSAASDPEYYALQWADHLVPWPSTVGGIVLPIAKFSLLAPYIGLASTAMIGAVASAVYVKRIKRRKEKQ